MYRQPSREIDLGAAAGREAVERAAEAFSRTSAGEGFILSASCDLMPTLLRLLAGGGLHWSPLAFGPPAWRAEVARIGDAERADGLADAFAYDHERLSALLSRVDEAARSRDAAGAAEALAALDLGHARHVAIEERHVFPAFRYAAHVRFGPLTEVLADQHRILDQTLARMRERVGQLAAGAASAEGFDDLTYLVGHFRLSFDAHTDKEETSLLPIGDDLLAAGMRHKILDALALWTLDGEEGGRR